MVPMVSLPSIWLPILLSAVAVFVASSIVHMVLGYHNTDFSRVPDEAAARKAFGALNLQPGDYCVPKPGSSAELKNPEYIAKVTEGPNIVFTVLRRGPPNMGPMLGQWFLFSVVVSLFAAYVASRTLAPGTPYLSVFRLTGTVAFCGYALGQWPAVIWYGKSGSATAKGTFDGLLYGLLTAGVFGWCWPG